MLPRGRVGVGPVPRVKPQGKFPDAPHCSSQSAGSSKHPGVVVEWRQGSDGKGEVSPPMGSIVSRNVGGEKGAG